MSEDLLAASWFRDRENDRTYHEKRDKIFILFFHAPYIVVNSYRFLNLFLPGSSLFESGEERGPWEQGCKFRRPGGMAAKPSHDVAAILKYFICLEDVFAISGN